MRLGEVLRCQFASSSQRGWWQLKLPSQIMAACGVDRARWILVERKVDSAVVVPLWIQSLYMLNRERWPNSPEKQAAEMSLEGICSWV